MANNAFATVGFVTANGPKREEIALDWYVRTRLDVDREEYKLAHDGKERGFPALVHRKCGVSAAHVSNVFDGSKSAGSQFAAGYAAWKGEPWEAFRRRAVEAWEASGQPSVQPNASPTAVEAMPMRWVERDGVLADALVADLIRGGHMTPDMRDSVRPRIILALGYASDGSVPSEAEQARIGFDAIAASKRSPLAQPAIVGDPIPKDSELRKPRPLEIEIPKKKRKGG